MDERLSGKSLMYIRKSNGPITLPWGTPDVTSQRLDEMSLINVSCSRAERKLRSQDRINESIRSAVNLEIK